MAIVVALALGCGASKGAAEEPASPQVALAPEATPDPSPPAEPEARKPVAETEQPRVPELASEWWTDPASCPKGATLVGAVPPKGDRVRCALSDGVSHGLEVMWIGDRIQVNTYKHGVYDGPYAVWRKDGQKLEEGMWMEGRQEGDFFQWFDDGALKVRGSYRGDRREGQWTYYQPDGTVERAVRYKAGRAIEETAGSK